jgi:hypothetical protein
MRAMTKSSNSPKTTRRSRRARLPVSSAVGLTFDPTDKDWGRIKKAYPDLSEADHETIIGIANKYLSRAQFERNAPFFDDAMAWLEATGKSARTFWIATLNEIATLNDEDSRKFEAIFHAQNYVARHIVHSAFKGSPASKWHELRTILESVVAAFAIARRDMPTNAAAGFVEGEAWEAMICRLTEWAEGKGYPTAASKKGADKTASLESSPFVAFIRELQNSFSEELRRHSHSDNAIAQAISVA